MKIIGITGGIGTGKSTVAEILRERGWTVYSSDETAREIMKNDAAVRQEIASTFGEAAADRQVLAGLVFGPTPKHDEARAALERIVHPRVMEAHMQQIEKHRAEGSPLIAIESALLFEVGLEEGFDYIVVVDAPEELQVRRAASRSTLSEDAVRARIAVQMPMEEKRRGADFVIDNKGTLDDLRKAVDVVALVLETLPEADE
ncbi:MAG: dephospho-CoA kinase [bacterium]|nr:dephospho-CoA kinase [bacterium]